MPSAERSIRGGFAFAALAAATFGLTTPLVQRLGRGVGPFTTAALLYAGAALVALGMRRPAAQEASLRREHASRIVVGALAGAMLAPAALAWGLQRTSGVSAGLALNLEAVFTAGLARILYREHVGPRVALALGLMTTGGVVLVLGHAHEGRPELLGLLAVTAATMAWGLDSALSNALSSLDTGQVVLAKASLGAMASLALSRALGEAAPSPASVAGLLACGAAGYGLSLRFYLLAQRSVGATRTASVFAVAPFLAAAAAAALGEPLAGWSTLAALVPMLLGLGLHLTERHAHPHRHEPLTHEHAHSHDDPHHAHVHVPPVAGAHSHRHTHEPLEHDHAHLPDLHHDH